MASPAAKEDGDLFGDDDLSDDEQEQFQEQQQHAEEDHRSDKQERAQALLALAKKRKAEQLAASGADGEDTGNNEEPDTSTRRGSKKGRAESSGPTTTPTAGPSHGGAGIVTELFGDDDEDDEEEEPGGAEDEPTKGDEEFIDDAGQDKEGSGAADDEDDAEMVVVEEAEEVEQGMEEVDDISRLLSKGKRKKKEVSEHDLEMAVDDMVSRMTAAAQEDRTEHAAGKPAFNKLKLLRVAEDFLVQRKHQQMFVAGDGMTVLAAWLEPYADGALPISKVRTSVLKMLQGLPVDTNHEGIRPLLAKSGLAKRVMFLYKCPDESVANQRVAKQLVEAWAKPIFEDYEREEEKVRQKQAFQMEARRQSLLAQQRLAQQRPPAAPVAAPKRNEPGFRHHAAVPQATKMDYAQNPRSWADGGHADDDEEQRRAGPPVARVNAMDKRLSQHAAAKGKGGIPRAAKVSIEGRQ